MKSTSLTTELHVLVSSVYQSWFSNDRSLRKMQIQLINYFCLVIICINPLLGFINFWLSHKIYGITSLVALCIFICNKFGQFHLARGLFIAGLYSIIFLHAAAEINGFIAILLFTIALIITVVLFSKVEMPWLTLSLGIMAILVVLLQFANHAFSFQTTHTDDLFGTAFISNIFCTLLSVVLAIYYLISIYEKSENNLRVLVKELQVKESEIRLRNEELLKLYENLLASREELIKSENFSNTIIDNLPVILFLKDAKEHTFTRINKTGEKLLNYPEADILNKRNSDLFPVNQATFFSETDKQVLATQSPVEYEEYLTDKAQNTHYVMTKKVPIYNTKGEITHILGISENITQRKLAEEKLKATLEELKTRNHELDNYVYRVSHDLRAPLCSIAGLTNLMKHETTSEVILHYVQLIERSVHKSDRFIQSILDQSKQLNSQIQIKSIDFPKIISECLEEYSDLIHSGKFKITVQEQGDVPFHSDEFRVTLILHNLIANAVRFVARQVDNPWAEFTICTSAKEAYITLTDNGIGIPSEHMDKIFDMFFRGTEKSDGNGLGLYIVKQSIEKLCGTIRVESTEGQGTTFSMVLPNMPL